MLLKIARKKFALGIVAAVLVSCGQPTTDLLIPRPEQKKAYCRCQSYQSFGSRGKG